MYANFPGREKMRKRGCMLSGGDLDAAQAMWCRNPGYSDEPLGSVCSEFTDFHC